MDKPLSSWLRTTFLTHWIISAFLGAALFLVPGRTLTILGWIPQWVQLPESELIIPGPSFVDNVLTRLLGVALLALAWSSFRGWRAKQRSEVEILIQTEAVFGILGVVAFIPSTNGLKVQKPQHSTSGLKLLSDRLVESLTGSEIEGQIIHLDFLSPMDGRIGESRERDNSDICVITFYRSIFLFLVWRAPILSGLMPATSRTVRMI